jgi:AraC-like DNA-binding protein
MLLLYFSGTDFVAFDSGSCRYDSFYGPLFSVHGLGAAQWRDNVLRAGGEPRIVSGLEIKYSERSFECALSIHPVGQKEFRRGVILGMIEEGSILKLLAGLQETYGGLIAVYDRSGSVVATTDGNTEQILRSSYYERISAVPDEEQRIGLGMRLKIHGASYRLYTVKSSVSDWTYVAALDESRVLEGPRRVMFIAVVILLACFIVGTCVSYLFALTNSRPVERIIQMILGEGGQATGGSTSVFQRVEEAIAGLADRNRRLEGEIASASLLARMNFLQLLLAGSCKDRTRLAADAGKVGVDLSGPHFVLIAGIATAGVSVKEAGEDFSRAVMDVGSSLRTGEYALLLSPGEASFILAVSDGEESSIKRAESVTEQIRGSCSPDFRGALSFGAGAVVDDPFLLAMSCAQAESARSRAARAGSLDLLASEKNGKSNAGDRYPIDLEEAVMRAVRSANVDLLRSLLASLFSSFEGAESDFDAEADLAAALRGTLLRLCAEFPKESSSLAARLDRTRSTDSRAAIGEISDLLEELAGLRECAKKSHNKDLAEAIRAFITDHFEDPNLGLAMVADTFRMSENYLSNLYKEQTGECISEAIEGIRISAAKEKLCANGDRLEAVAASCGYRSVASFRRAFKRVVGVSPSDFRRSSETA